LFNKSAVRKKEPSAGTARSFEGDDDTFLHRS